jgi:hypothetical protein
MARQQSVCTAFTAASQMSHMLTNAYAVVAALPASQMIQVDSRGAMAIAYDTDDLRDAGHDLQCVEDRECGKDDFGGRHGVILQPRGMQPWCLDPGQPS